VYCSIETVSAPSRVSSVIGPAVGPDVDEVGTHPTSVTLNAAAAKRSEAWWRMQSPIWIKDIRESYGWRRLCARYERVDGPVIARSSGHHSTSTTLPEDTTMTKRSENQKGNQKGPQQHAEGQQGERTHARFQEQINEHPPTEDDNVIARHREGKHRLDENREQHDEADLQSDKNRIAETRGGPNREKRR
jgi:hypothetical protein